MSYLADSNILTALSQKRSPQYTWARTAITDLRRRNEIVFIFPQNLVEFWSVATRPISVNGLGLDVQKAILELRKFRRYLVFAEERPNLFSRWESLVQKHEVKGKNAHDARIVAAMLQHGITHLLTFNTSDFKRFSEITVVDPRSVKVVE